MSAEIRKVSLKCEGLLLYGNITTKGLSTPTQEHEACSCIRTMGDVSYMEQRIVAHVLHLFTLAFQHKLNVSGVAFDQALTIEVVKGFVS